MYMILYGVGMLVVTLILQYYLFKTNKNINFWRGTEPVFILAILGLLSNEVGDFAGILGYVVGDYIGNLSGWHKINKKKK